MEQYLTKGIKTIIEDHPVVADILERYHIACVPCTVGTCSLADVTKFHHLPAQTRAHMMYEIEKALYPDRDVPPPPVFEDEPPPAEPRLSPPLQQLVEEHAWIKRMLAVLPVLLRESERTGVFGVELMHGLLDFIRGYADRFHHLKEEDILFDYVDPEEALVRVIHQDHARAREYVKTAAAAVESGEAPVVRRALRSYRQLLAEHIDKEDHVLYPYLDRGLSTHQVGELFGRFAEAEAQLEKDVPERYTQFVQRLEHRYAGGEPDQ